MVNKLSKFVSLLLLTAGASGSQAVEVTLSSETVAQVASTQSVTIAAIDTTVPKQTTPTKLPPTPTTVTEDTSEPVLSDLGEMMDATQDNQPEDTDLAMLESELPVSDEISYDGMPKCADVFGVRIFASEMVQNDRLLHAARVLAQYLDNDEDGIPDNQKVVDQLVKVNAAMIMFADEEELDEFDWESVPGDREPHLFDLLSDETTLDFDPSGSPRKFDATLEEVLHMITSSGYSLVYPVVFGESPGSEIAVAMDMARGGHFLMLPSEYPEEAWYTYDDYSCSYEYQVVEYTYWALTSLLGAQAYSVRLEEIGDEWKLNTADLLSSKDAVVYAILTNQEYGLPTVLPNAAYDGFQITMSGSGSHDGQAGTSQN